MMTKRTIKKRLQSRVQLSQNTASLTPFWCQWCWATAKMSLVDVINGSFSAHWHNFSRTFSLSRGFYIHLSKPEFFRARGFCTTIYTNAPFLWNKDKNSNAPFLWNRGSTFYSEGMTYIQSCFDLYVIITQSFRLCPARHLFLHLVSTLLTDCFRGVVLFLSLRPLME